MIRKYWQYILFFLALVMVILFLGYSYLNGNPLELSEAKKSADLYVKAAGINGLKVSSIYYDKKTGIYTIKTHSDETIDLDGEFYIEKGKIKPEISSRDFFRGLRNENTIKRILKGYEENLIKSLKDYGNKKGIEIEKIEILPEKSYEEIRKDLEVENFYSSIYNKKDFLNWMGNSNLHVEVKSNSYTWDDIFYLVRNSTDSFNTLDFHPKILQCAIKDSEEYTIIGVKDLPWEIAISEDFSTQIDDYIYSGEP